MQISSLWVPGQGILQAQQEMGAKVWLLGKRPEVQRTEPGGVGCCGEFLLGASLICWNANPIHQVSMVLGLSLF